MRVLQKQSWPQTPAPTQIRPTLILEDAMKTPQGKPFYITSEFWLHNLAQLLLWAGALPTAGTPGYFKTIVSVAAAAAYIVSRGFAKAGTSPTAIGDQAPPPIPASVTQDQPL
jgi:hypothetical protein